MSGTSLPDVAENLEPLSGARPASHEYLIVDDFLRSFVEARALKTGFELGLLDRLAQQGSGAVNVLAAILGVDRQGLRLLLDLLTASGVVLEHRGDVRLTHRFQTALRYRDILDVKLDYIGFTINDFADHFTTLVRSEAGFMSKARLFHLFDYRRALDSSIESYKRTRTWMRVTSTLTKYEAIPCLDLYDAGQHRRMLDIGGNSGEFALQFCRRNPHLRATVFDLPLVCQIGLDHVLPFPERSRVAFMAGDMREQRPPTGFDLITFKSMLHDWPADQVRMFIDKAARALAPGGTLLIYERGALQLSKAVPAMSMVPNLLFYRSYRQPVDYMDQLEALGFEDVRRQDIDLDCRFHLITARKPTG